MIPREVLSQRRRLVEWLRTDAAPMLYETFEQPDRTDELLHTLVGAPCYYVSAEMTAVARHAAKTMPDQLPLHHDFPSTSGFIVWDAPLVDNMVASAMEWGEDSARVLEHARIVSWRLVDEVDVNDTNGRLVGTVPGAIMTKWGPYEGQLIPSQTAVLDFTVPLRQTVVDDNPDDPFSVAFITQFNMTFYATLVLMGQTLAAVETVRADRAENRRGARSQIPVSEVTVISLRKRAGSTETSDTSRPVDWQRRWVVDGHWRQQWYPSLNDHRAIYIHEYVKGPDDKPLVMNEKVNALRR